MLTFMISVFLLFLKQEISVHQFMLSIYATRFGELAWLVQLKQLQMMLLILLLCIVMGHRRPLISINVLIHVMYPVKNIIQKISTPTTSTGRINKINDEEFKKLFLNLPNLNNNKLLYVTILLLPFAKCFISVNKCLIKMAKT